MAHVGIVVTAAQIQLCLWDRMLIWSVRSHATSVAQYILHSNTLRVTNSRHDKVIREEAGHGRIPLHLKMSIIVVYQHTHSRSRKRFGTRANVKERFCCAWSRIRKTTLAISGRSDMLVVDDRGRETRDMMLEHKPLHERGKPCGV